MTGAAQGGSGAQSQSSATDAGLADVHQDAGGNAGTTPGADVELLRAATPAQSSPDISDAAYATFIAHLNKFGLDLGQATSAAEKLSSENLVYSPLSATLALAMTYAGARGQTAEEMKLVLGDTFEGNTFHAGCNRVTRELTGRVMPGDAANSAANRVDLALANSLFVAHGLDVQDAFLQLLAAQYDTGVRRVDFQADAELARQAINTWVSGQTHATINDLIPVGAVDASTRLVLVNALYFYASWQQPFAGIATSNAVFHTLAGDTALVPMMASSQWLAHTENEELAVADLPYVGGHLRMTIVLPGVGMFAAVRAKVSAAWLEQTTSQLTPKNINIQLPKFRFAAGSFSLKGGLQALGMTTAFTDAADFTGISQSGLSIAKVLQKAFVSVEEQGTEAAAATAVILAGTSAPAIMTPFIVDRPFLFFIRDDSGAILFSGQVVDPSR